MQSTIPSQTRLRALVTDDTALYRRAISDILASLPDVEVIGAAYDGEDCLALAEKLKPDLITLDIQMPRRDGLSTLQELKKRGSSAEVVMICSETMESANQTMSALRMGALDMVLKPAGSDILSNKQSLESQLSRHVQTIRFQKSRRPSARLDRTADQPSRSSSQSQAVQQPSKTSQPASPVNYTGNGKPKCVCIGISTGGPQSLSVLIKGLPHDLSVPVFIVQHMPPVFTKSLANHLSSITNLSVSEATHEEKAQPGHIYIAPGGKHMKIDRIAAGYQIQITDDPPIGACKPSVDYLFQSVDACCGKDTLAIIMTGMGSDGLAGCKRLHASGARILAQDAETSVVYGMPRQIAENGLAHEILPLEMIASRITQLIRR